MVSGLVFLDIFISGLVFTSIGALVVGVCAPVLARILKLPALASEWMTVIFILAIFLWPLTLLPLVVLPFTARKDVSFSDIFNA